MFWSGFGKGFMACAGLVGAIGAQSTFVLGRGIERQFVFATIVTCAMCDALIIVLGFYGGASAFALQPLWQQTATYLGIVFLLGYGLLSIKRARLGVKPEALSVAPTSSLRSTVFTAAGISFLNPQAYFDSIVILGGMALGLATPERNGFVGGAVAASASWYFILGYGARFVAPVLSSERTRGMLDIAVGCMMLWLAAGLLLKSF
jgi:L-lysine exporter family protein LysE/ArgO